MTMQFLKFTYRLLLPAALLLLSACGKDFLEEEPSGPVSKEQLAKLSNLNPESSLGGIRGIYAMTFQVGLTGNKIMGDFGQIALNISGDILSGDIAQLTHNYDVFSGISNLTGTGITGGSSEMAWKYYYKIIRATNDVIEPFEENKPETPEDKWTFGQGKALRAYAYLYLVNFFQNPYAEARNAKGVILRNKNDTKPGKLATVEEVYQVITNDLETAVESLEGFERPGKNAINQNVARALLAYAYLFMEQYDKAEKLADEIINSGEFTLMSKEEVIESGFREISTPGWMWGIEITKENTPYLRGLFGMLDLFTYGYQAYTGWVINKELYAEIPETDVRKQQFSEYYYIENGDTIVSYKDLYPIKKFYTTGGVPDGDKNWTSDEVYMRIAEMYLIKAEAQARQNKDGEAKTTLLELLSQRDSKAVERINPLSGENLLDEIYFQWRIEMWGEGKALWAMKRFKKTNKRSSTAFIDKGEEFSYNDSRLIFRIPESERNNNANIGDND